MALKAYIVERLLQIIPLFFLASLLIFLIVNLAPGDPVYMITHYAPGAHVWSPEDIEALRRSLGLDRPIHERYLRWLWNALQGDLGHSYIYNLPIKELVIPAFMNTIKLEMLGLTFAILIAIPIGVTSAVKQYSKTDYACMLGALIFWSLPWFLSCLLFIFIFSLWLGWFPSYGAGGPTFIEQIHHMLLPVIVLGLSGGAFTARLVRSNMLEVLRQDYIPFARSKGIHERRVIYYHALKNAMCPVVTFIGLYFATMLSGAAIIETVFGYSGIGFLIVDSSLTRDYPTVMACTLIVTLFVVFSTFIVDILYVLIDPRIRY